MAVVDQEHEAELEPGDTEVLFPEARRFQRRRQLGITAAVLATVLAVVTAVVAGLVLSGSRSLSSRNSTGQPAAVPVAQQLTLRPVLCDVPAYDPNAPRSGALGPNSCGSRYALTASNLDIRADPSIPPGYSARNIAPDPTLRGDASTPVKLSDKGGTVLLPGPGGIRYLLGPLGLRLSPHSVVSRVTLERGSGGTWFVLVTLTSSGAMTLDSVMKPVFHRYVAIVLDGEVLEAPVVQPTSISYQSFGGDILIGFNFTKQQAEKVAAHL